MIRHYFNALSNDLPLQMTLWWDYNNVTGSIEVKASLNQPITVDVNFTVLYQYLVGSSPVVDSESGYIPANGTDSLIYSKSIPGSPSSLTVTRIGINSFTPTTYNGQPIDNKSPY